MTLQWIPNIAPSKEVMDALNHSLSFSLKYMYSLHDTKELKETIQAWVQKTISGRIGYRNNTVSAGGSQEGLAHVALALCDEGDIVLIPAPSYPIFANGPKIAGAELYEMPMLKEYDYLIQFDAIPEEIAEKAKMMIISIRIINRRYGSR